MKIISVLIFLIILFLSCIGINMFKYGYGFSDGFWRTLVAPVEGTVWPPGFSEEAFSKVRVGMSVEQVKELIGMPKSGYCTDKCYWSYTTKEEGLPGYDRRFLLLDENRLVEKVIKEFYLD